jgi:hypothetical protein
MFVAGCSTSSVQFVDPPDMNVAIENPEMARVYILRGGDIFAENKRLFVVNGERVIGALGRDNYLCWERRGVITQLVYYLDAGARPSGETTGNHRLQAKPGKTYYLEVSMPRGSNHMQTKEMLPEYARHLISERRLAPLEALPAE